MSSTMHDPFLLIGVKQPLNMMVFTEFPPFRLENGYH